MPMQFDLVSPERRLASREADAVIVPGVEGDLTAMPDHAPFLTTLRPGYVTVTGGGSSEEYFVTGGFAEISGKAISVLAERAVPRREVDRELLETLIAAAERRAADAGEDLKIAAAQRVADLRVLAGQIG